MSQVIIYRQDNGAVAAVHPTDEALTVYAIDAIARKDVPFGKQYKIIDAEELPTYLSMPNAWSIDDADGLGAESDVFPPDGNY
jgi:hypothetical protein